MNHKLASAAVLAILLLGFLVYVPVTKAAIISTSVTTTLKGPEPLVNITAPVSTVIKPTYGQVSEDLGIETFHLTPRGTMSWFNALGNFSLSILNISLVTTPLPFRPVAQKNSSSLVISTKVQSATNIQTLISATNTSEPYQKEIKISGTVAPFIAPVIISLQFANPQQFKASVCDSAIHKVLELNGTVVSIPACSEAFFGDMGIQLGCSQNSPGINQTSIHYNNVTLVESFSVVQSTFSCDPLALNGSGSTVWNGGTSKTCTLTTTNTNDIIMVSVVGVPSLPLTSGQITIADTSTLTWNVRGYLADATSGLEVEWWYAKSSGILSADVITLTITRLATAMNNGLVTCFGVSGADQTTIFDPNGAIPATGSSNGATHPFLVISTSNANDFLFGMADVAGGAGLNSPTGFTDIIATACGSYSCATGYNIVSSTQSSVTEVWSGDTGSWVAGMDAIMAPAAIQPLLFVLKVNPPVTHVFGAVFNPSGGAIYKSVTTVVASTTVTISSSSVFTITAAEFASYIWNGWTGANDKIFDNQSAATTLVTVDPTATVSITATATTAETSTLTANFFSINETAPSPPPPAAAASPDYSWLLLVPLIFAVPLAVKKVRV